MRRARSRAPRSTSDLPTIDDLNLAGTLLLDDLTYFLDDPTRYFFSARWGSMRCCPPTSPTLGCHRTRPAGHVGGG